MVVGPQGADTNIWMVLIPLREGADAGYANVVQPTYCKQLLHYLQEQSPDA